MNDTATNFQDVLLEGFLHSFKDGKWHKCCRPKKGRRVKSGDWWRRKRSERPFRPYRDQESQEFVGIPIRYASDPGGDA